MSISVLSNGFECYPKITFAIHYLIFSKNVTQTQIQIQNGKLVYFPKKANWPQFHSISKAKKNIDFASFMPGFFPIFQL